MAKWGETVVTMGDMSLELVSEEAGASLAEAHTFYKEPGGAPANIAIAVARLGGRAAFVGKLGDDHFGQNLVGALRSNGVDTEGVVLDAGARTALTFVTRRTDREQERIYYGRNPSLNTDDLNVKLIKQAGILHYESSSLISEPCRTAHKQAMRIAKEAGVLLSFAPNMREATWSSHQEARTEILGIWGQAEIIYVTEDDIDILTKTGSTEDIAMKKLFLPTTMLLLLMLNNEDLKYYYRDFHGVVSCKTQKIDSAVTRNAFIAALLWKIVQEPSSLEDPKALENAIQYVHSSRARITKKKGSVLWLPSAEDKVTKNDSFRKSNQKNSRFKRKPVHFDKASTLKKHKLITEETFSISAQGKLPKEFNVPLKIYNDLKSHQKEGINWLWDLHCSSKGGILADDMGLGKTRQVTSFLCGLFYSKIITRALVVAPPTLIFQWKREFAVVGLKEEVNILYNFRLKQQKVLVNNVLQVGGILLASYDMVRTHMEKLQAHWDYIIADEGHTIKNPQTKTAAALCSLNCVHKILITGTPIQNRMEEIHGLFKFCQPDLLGSLSDFKKKFVKPVLKGSFKTSSNKDLIASIKSLKAYRDVIQPYFLRREKKQILAAQALSGEQVLPSKTEFVVWLKLSPFQIKLYTKLLTKGMIDKKIEGSSFVAMMLLRCICNHPCHMRNSLELKDDESRLMVKMLRKLETLVPQDDFGPEEEASSKLPFILKLTEKLLGENHKVLIFSQTHTLLRLLKNAFSKGGYQYFYMDGKTPNHDRDEMVEHFQQDDGPPIFLLTTLVGGVGLTLTSASRVIMADPSWNPSVDNQCVDRVNRMGQKKDVVIYRLIAASTIEEKIYEKQLAKTGVFKELSGSEIYERYVFKQVKNELFTLPQLGFHRSKVHERFNCTMKKKDDKFKEHETFLKELGIIGLTIHSELFKTTISSPNADFEETDTSKVALQPCRQHRNLDKDVVKGPQNRPPVYTPPDQVVETCDMTREQRRWNIQNLKKSIKRRRHMIETLDLIDSGANLRRCNAEDEEKLQKLLAEEEADAKANIKDT